MAIHKTRYIQVESKNALLELVRSGAPFHKILVASNAFRDHKTKLIINEAEKRNIPIERVPRKKIDRMARTATCESVIGLKPAPEQQSLRTVLETAHSKRAPLFVLILNNIHYIQNVGALFRTAYGSGVDVVIVPKKKNNYLTEEVTRISMGASERIPIVQMNLFDAMKQLKDAGIKIIGVHMNGKPYFKVDLKGDVALVLGSEDTGISHRVLERCDTLAQIPMEEGIDSLNVSAAGAIIMFEKKRQDSSK